MVVALTGWLTFRFAAGPTLNPNLTALLPAAESDLVVATTAAVARQEFERSLTFVVAAPSEKAARAAAAHAYDALRQSGEFDTLQYRVNAQDLQATGSLYFAHRFQLLSRESRRQLLAQDEAGFERAVLARYFAPTAAVNSTLIEKDPLLLVPDFLVEALNDAAARFRPTDGVLALQQDGTFYVLFSGVLAETPFSFALQQRLMPVLQTLKDRLPSQFGGAGLLIAGVLPHAAKGTINAEREVSSNGLLSLAGITVLLWVVFRSARCLTLTVLSISVGCIAGFAVCLALFGEVYLLTLVFGTSFVGIAVDYSLLYFSEQFRLGKDWTPDRAIHHVLPGITMGLVTSIIGFAGLLLAPFPGLQQMAVFSIAGLTASYACVLAWNPFLMRRPVPGSEAAGILRPAAGFVRLWRNSLERRWWFVLPFLAVVGIIGCLRLATDDDIRLLQTLDPQVIAEENRVRSLTGQNIASQFFLVEGSDAADLLAREEQLTGRLRQAQNEGRLAGHVALSDFVPSPQRQAENRALLAPLVISPEGLLMRLAARIGLPAATVNACVRDFVETTASLELKDWLARTAVNPYSRLWLGETGRGVASIVALRGVNDLDALRALGSPEDRIHFVDVVGDLSDLFGRFRREAAWLTLASYGMVSLLTVMRYGWHGGIRVMLPPLFAALLALGTLGFLGEPLTLFNVMALLLVLGIGADYGLFLREAGNDDAATVLAVAMAAVSTILAFGLLALSATAAIHSFGITVFVGIGAACLLSPLGLRTVLRTTRRPPHLDRR